MSFEPCVKSPRRILLARNSPLQVTMRLFGFGRWKDDRSESCTATRILYTVLPPCPPVNL
jgi:hypothetical protein